ncbi:AGAP004835-PA [Anopheles gambiae str. PEST]|uniref:AGAP004835-PA n=1 Tax=Anopheles gambiae TaxID=7165 RepID=Q7Q944_ANOGA|nr:AGAP004835-PA [Anopheles gambiae str. PEST]
MFGSKLRSWMENHIVRPRKKGNKNKSGNNGNNFSVLTTQNGYKSSTFGTDSNIGSPARRSEVSPIQSHTTSRRGWHSPNQDNVPISPKSDHYPVHHRIHNKQAHDGGAELFTTGYGAVNGQSGAASFHNQQQHHQQYNCGVSSPKSISRNGSSYTLETGPSNVYYSKSVDSTKSIASRHICIHRCNHFRRESSHCHRRHRHLHHHQHRKLAPMDQHLHRAYTICIIHQHTATTITIRMARWVIRFHRRKVLTRPDIPPMARHRVAALTRPNTTSTSVRGRTTSPRALRYREHCMGVPRLGLIALDPWCLLVQLLQAIMRTVPNSNVPLIASRKNTWTPSPRQRCRIRTNPWLTTADGALASANCVKRTEPDSGSTSSGIKSSSGTDDNKNNNNKSNALSDTDSSSSTEKIVNRKPFTPKTLKKMADFSRLDSRSAPVTIGSNQDSDEDATLNEMMGKFDESYHYEKETDILSCSDSDPTDCPTDIDTGQDAGDECDTDDLLDLDFIDTGSVQEVPDKETYRHTTSCSIHQFPERKASCKQQRIQRSKRSNESGGGSKRRKKLVRTRKKSAADHSALSVGSGAGDSSAVVSRGCRSLGGTPVSLRRNQQDQELRTPTRGSPLTNRCNSLTFTEVHSLHSRILAISESEKALLRADLEADVKYKQLIHEAESILFSMKSNSSICIKDLATVPPPLPPREPQPPPTPSLSKDTPVTSTTISSPRRVCNPPANKRVEMLRNCEADLKRELAKTCSQKCTDGAGNPAELNPAEGVIVNKRLEVLRYETSCSLSAPNSPKNTRVLLPRKTHVSNFIHHQARPPCSPEALANDLKQSANLSPPPPPPRRMIPKSPTIMRRRFRSQSPHLNIESDSDSDEVSRNLDCKAHGKSYRTGTSNNNNKENLVINPQPATFQQPTVKPVVGKQMNNFRHTIHGPAFTNGEDGQNGYDYPDDTNAISNHASSAVGMHKSPLISFRSVDIGSPVTDDSYCPQSEPLKRKIYTCSAAFEKIQRSLHHDTGKRTTKNNTLKQNRFHHFRHCRN